MLGGGGGFDFEFGAAARSCAGRAGTLHAARWAQGAATGA